MFLSIVIPVYNAEKYLAECLDSCLAQDHPREDYEIICVNDGSTDSSADILAEYSGRYSNIQVLTQENAGVSAARNAGIRSAAGEYVWFVDADDFIRENVTGTLYQTAQQSCADQISFGHFEFTEALSQQQLLQKQSGLLSPNATPPGYLIVESLFRRTMLLEHGLLLREGISYAEDGLFCYEFSQLKPSVCILDQVFYFYRRNPTSATRTRNSEANRRRHDSARQVALIMTEYARKHRDEVWSQGPEQRAAVLMPDVRVIVTSAAQLPSEHRRTILKALSENGLFPLFLYPKPRDWFPKKIHMSHAHMGLKGKLLDIITFYSTTRLGFAALVFYYKIRRKG